MTKKLISIIFALVFTISSFSVLNITASAKDAKKVYPYKTSSALSYAAKNWNNGRGLCADFASKCVQAGGINVYSARVVDLYNQLNGIHGTSHKLTLTGGTRGTIKMSDNKGKLEKGDLIFYFCNCCRKYTHVVVCNGANSQGYVQDYAHNNAHNGKKQTYTYNHCGTQNWTMYSINLDKGNVRYGARTNVTPPKISSVKNDANGIVVKWNKISGADSYRVYRKTSKSDWKKVYQGSKTSYTDKNTINGEKYYYMVRAIDNKVLSQYYEGKSIVALNAPKLSISNTVGSVTVKWSKVGNADGYYVYRKNEKNAWVRVAKITNGKTTSFKDKNVENGKSYKYTVKAYDGKLAGAFVSKGITIKYVSEPKNFTAKPVENGMLISFSAINGATKYKVYRKGVNEKTWTALGFTTTPSIIDTTGVPGESYNYTARAVNGKTYSGNNGKALTAVYSPIVPPTTETVTTPPVTEATTAPVVTTTTPTTTTQTTK